MRIAVWNPTRNDPNLPRRPHLRHIPKANINNTPTKFFGTFAVDAGEEHTDKRSRTLEAFRLRARFHKMLEEAKVPMETEEGSFGPGQIVSKASIDSLFSHFESEAPANV